LIDIHKKKYKSWRSRMAWWELSKTQRTTFPSIVHPHLLCVEGWMF